MTRNRLADIALSMGGILVLSAPMMMIGLLIWLDSGFPILFRHERVGQDGRRFQMLKFRTMTSNAGSIGGPLTVDRDPRITRTGRYLRRFKLDELPQLLNVLRGDMALVGPRPEVPTYVDRYSDSQREVLRLRPGITDPASLAFWREEEILAAATDPEEFYLRVVMPEKIRLNLIYAQSATRLSDLRVILRTVLGMASRGSRHPRRGGTPESP